MSWTELIKDEWRSWRSKKPAPKKDDEHKREDIKVPVTVKGEGVFLGNLVALIVVWLVGSMVLHLFFDRNFIFAAVGTVIFFGWGTANNIFAVNVPDWYGALLFNPFTRKRRVLFAGFHWKLWWEHMEPDAKGDLFTWLLREITTPPKKYEWSTTNPAMVMQAEMLLHFRIDTRDKNPLEDADRFISFRSVEPHALEEIMDAEIEHMFSDHYGRHEVHELNKTKSVMHAVLPHDGSANDKALHELEDRLGGHLGVILKYSKPNSETIELLKTPARAESVRKAMEALTKDKGMSKDMARRAAMILDPNTDYTETHFGVNLTAKGLERLENFSVVAPPSMLGGESKTKAKGRRT